MVKRCADIKFLLAARVLDRVMRDFQPQATQGPKNDQHHHHHITSHGEDEGLMASVSEK